MTAMIAICASAHQQARDRRRRGRGSRSRRRRRARRRTIGIEGGMIGPITAVAAVSAAAKLGGVAGRRAVIIFCISLPLPAASAIAEPDMPAKMIALHDVDLGEAAAEAADERVAEVEQPLGHAARVHDLGREDEERHREQDVARVHAVQQLLGGGAHVQAGEPAGRGSSRRSSRGRSAGRGSASADDARRCESENGLARLHTPELALVGSNASGAAPARAPTSTIQSVADDRRRRRRRRRSRTGSRSGSRGRRSPAPS